MKLDFDGKGVTGDTYLLRKLNMANVPFSELYIHTYQFKSDQIHSNISCDNEEDLKALEWLVRDYYDKTGTQFKVSIKFSKQ